MAKLTLGREGVYVLKALLLFSFVCGSEASSGLSTKGVDMIGYASYEFGQIVKGQWNGGDVSHYWSHNLYAGVGFNATVSDNFDITAQVEGKM